MSLNIVIRKQRTVIQGRVMNQIQILKRNLSKGDDFFTYNDLLIIAQIIPKLPETALVPILQGLRNMNDTLNSMPQTPSLDILPLLVILAGVKEEVGDHLLNDFLCSVGYDKYSPEIDIC